MVFFIFRGGRGEGAASQRSSAPPGHRRGHTAVFALSSSLSVFLLQLLIFWNSSASFSSVFCFLFSISGFYVPTEPQACVCVCLCVCVCVFGLRPTEYQNTHSTGKMRTFLEVRTFWLVLTGSIKGLLEG